MSRDCNTLTDIGSIKMTDSFVMMMDKTVEAVLRNPELHRYLLCCSSRQSLEKKLQELAGFHGNAHSPELTGYLDLLTKVEPSYYFENPKVGKIKLEEIRGAMKWLIMAAWLGSNVFSFFSRLPVPGTGIRFPGSHNHRPDPGSRENATAVTGSESAGEVPYLTGDINLMRDMFNCLGTETWRLYIDWEDQEFGPEVYDSQKHGREGTTAEPGYISNMLLAHDLMLSHLGEPLTADTYEELYRICVKHFKRKFSNAYRKFEREYWRPKDWCEPGFLDDIEPQYLYQFKHRLYEVLAIRHLKYRDEESFRRENPLVADLIMKKYGNLRINTRVLNREYHRFRVRYFQQPRTRELVKAEINRLLENFYREMFPLVSEKQELITALADKSDNDPDTGYRIKSVEDRQLLMIARLYKRLEYLRPFVDGNTRLNGLVLNKLLVESGFVPAIVAQRNDAPFYTDNGWKKMLCEGMRRWQAIRIFHAMGCLDHVLAFREVQGFRNDDVAIPADQHAES